MMGQKTAQPKLYYSFSLDQAVPSNHLVRRLAAAVDFSFVYGLVRRYYSRTGQPSVDPVVLFKLSLLGYLFNITSERRLCEEASLNLAWRWFLGYELDEPIPDHSVLSKARRRFGPVVYERFFRRIVELCEARGLVQGDVLFVDSTLTRADASKESLRSRALLQQLEPPKKFVAELWQVNEETETTEPQPAREPKPRPDRGVVNERTVSATDPDAELVSQRGKPAMLAHKVHMVVDGGRARIVTAVAVRPAGENDSHAMELLLDKHATAVEQPARELVADSGYTSEPALKACEKRGLLPTLAKRSTSNRHGGWDRDRFTYVPERDVFVCPAGHEMHHSNENLRFRQSVYRTVKGTCHRCPLKASCSPGRGERSVTRRWHAGLWEEFELHLSSRRARHHLRRRKVIVEPIIGDSKVKHGLDRACFRGRENMLIQALLTASVLNIKQLVRRVPIPQAGSAALAVSPPTPVAACSRQRSSAHRLHCRRASHRSASRREADGPPGR
jgi:transposase